ncbi:MAG: hypothetical protein HY882_13760 [Deltaproteobacteria bacterium]|nr:hypothetical protein [Deltaproteobacteria bacterium]
MVEAAFAAEAQLREAWEKAYVWLTPQEREELKAWARTILEIREADFQDRLKKIVFLYSKI